MATIGFLGFVVAIVGAIVFSIKKNIIWKKWLAGAGVAFILFIAGASFSPSNPSSEQKNSQANNSQTEPETHSQKSQTASETQSQKSEPKSIPGTLSLNPNEFKTRFNKASQEFESDLKISNLKVETGTVQNTFQYMLTDRLALLGTVNKADGSIRDISMLGQGDGTVKSGMNILTTMGILIASIDPEISPSERGDILKDLGVMGDNVDIYNVDNKTIRNGRRYWINSSKEIGIMFGVSDANEK